MWVFLLMMSLLLCPVAASTARPDVKPGCQDKCGNVSVPYPFGILERSCAMNKHFFLNCSSGADGQPELLFARNFPAREISVLEGTLTASLYTAFTCYNETGSRTDNYPQSFTLGSGPFMLSDTRNVFTVIGCDTYAGMTNYEFTYGAACLSLCTEDVNMSDGNPCSGSGCCQTPIPKGLKSLNYPLSSFYNYTNVSDFNLCGFAFLVDKKSFKISDWPLSRKPKYGKDAYTTDIVIEWVVKNETCEQAKANQSTYACGTNAKCTYPENIGQGYRCLCNEGFEGNPYLPEGCQVDIDECKVRGKNACQEGTCENVIGDYKCRCPRGKYGDGKTGCKGVGINTIIAVLLLLIGAWWMSKLIKRRKCIQLKKLFFKRNGGLLLQQQLSSSDGSVQKTKIFSSNELEKATDYFNENRILGHGGQGTVYKGMLADGSIVAVKKSTIVDEEKLEEFINEVVILSQINHRNVVRLLGCCLETDVPLLVYEFIPNGTLSHYLHEQNEDFTLSWESRLRIASEAAGAISYLHSTASIPIYHRDIKSTNILLDEKYRAKVSDFGTSRSVSIDQTHLTTKVQGTFGYLDPEYFRTSQLTGKSDVYSFGVVLVELLSGKKPIFLTHSLKTMSLAEHFIELMEDSRLFDIIDAQVKGDCTEEEAIVIANLAKRCLNMNGRNRPTMREVAMELEGILLSRNGINIQQMVEVDNSSRSISCSSFEIGTDVPLDCKPLTSSETW
uniref:Protein kinase domain-containing protein n=1 Tax=Populus trichocarpa TaxID=3694 RepID=A0A3N7F0P6_POPTR